MKKIISGFFCGILLTGLISFFLIKMVYEDEYDQAYRNGVIGGKYELSDQLMNEFGRDSFDSNHREVDSFKLRQVISITTNGIKTVRVIDAELE